MGADSCLGISKLKELFEFDAFKVTPNNLILYNNFEKFAIPRTMVKFNFVGVLMNEKIYVRREENELI